MYSTASIGAEDTFTDPVSLDGQFNLSISGTWVGTVTLQRSFDGGSNWVDVNTWSENFEGWDNEPVKPSIVPDYTQYRVGIKTGEYTSGTAVCRVGR